MTQFSMISAIAGQWEKPICLPHGLCWTKMGHMKVQDQGSQTSKFTVLSSYPFSSSTIWDREG